MKTDTKIVPTDPAAPAKPDKDTAARNAADEIVELIKSDSKLAAIRIVAAREVFKVAAKQVAAGWKAAERRNFDKLYLAALQQAQRDADDGEWAEHMPTLPALLDLIETASACRATCKGGVSSIDVARALAGIVPNKSQAMDAVMRAYA